MMDGAENTCLLSYIYIHIYIYIVYLFNVFPGRLVGRNIVFGR